MVGWLTINGQPFSDYFPGSYYDLEGKKRAGFVFYSVESHSDYIKFKEDKGSKTLKFNTKKIKAFIYQSDSFVVLEKVRMENSVGNLYNNRRFFAHVLDTGKIILYRYFDDIDSLNRYNSDQGFYNNSPVWGNDYVNFLLQKKGSPEIIGVRKRKYSKFKEQMIEFFKDYPEFQNKIQNNTYRWATLPGLVKEVNSLP